MYVSDDELKSTNKSIYGKDVVLKEVEYENPNLLSIRIHVLNLKKREETPLRIYVTEDFLIDGGLEKISEGTILVLLIIGIVLFCLCSLGAYVYYRRKLSEEFFEPITETDERFLQIFEIRKKIRKIERKARDVVDNSDMLVERKKLLAELEQIKEAQTDEFLGYLEFIQFYEGIEDLK